jgi:hypothetical protein
MLMLAPQTVDHGGYSRPIIAVNPPYIDDDGDIYSDASSDREDLQTLEENPYAEVQLHTLLRPLTAASELPHHPTLRIPFESAALTKMAEEAEEMLRRERANLWKAKRVLQRFRGDADWAPCGMFDTEDGDRLLDGETATEDIGSIGLSAVTDRMTVDGEGPAPNGVAGIEAHDFEGAGDPTRAPEHDEEDKSHAVVTNGTAPVELSTEAEQLPNGHETSNGVPVADQPMENNGPSLAHLSTIIDRDTAAASDAGSGSAMTNTHAMTTRRRARSPSSEAAALDLPSSPSPSDSLSTPAIHPWFVAPSTSVSDRDLGLPILEAEEARRLLLLYVQKQEQIVRSLESLFQGLQKSDRLRRFVYKACKADGHVVPDGKGNFVTEMSDGEDWHDVADWGIVVEGGVGGLEKEGNGGGFRDDLMPGLEKGKDEVEDLEEEGRKVRGRRRVSRM